MTVKEADVDIPERATAFVARALLGGRAQCRYLTLSLTIPLCTDLLQHIAMARMMYGSNATFRHVTYGGVTPAWLRTYASLGDADFQRKASSTLAWLPQPDALVIPGAGEYFGTDYETLYVGRSHVHWRLRLRESGGVVESPAISTTQLINTVEKLRAETMQTMIRDHMDAPKERQRVIQLKGEDADDQKSDPSADPVPPEVNPQRSRGGS